MPHLCDIKPTLILCEMIAKVIVLRTPSDRAANAIWSDGVRNPIGRRTGDDDIARINTI